MASLGQSQQQHNNQHNQRHLGLDSPGDMAAAAGRCDILLEAGQHPSGVAPRRGSFCSQRLVFEQTLEILRQVLRSTGETCGGGGGTGLGVGVAESRVSAACAADSRSLLLIVALHRRLLEQVGALRAELPPICRLIAPSSGGANQPLDRSLASANHRALADLEERLYLVVSRHSLARLSAALADPLLKLEEFLLVFELVNDLVCFVGQKCKQNYSQRARQLLNELTPVTGCPSLSSTEDEEDEEEPRGEQTYGAGSLAQQQRTFGGSTLALAMQAGGAGSAQNQHQQMKRLSQQERYANYEPSGEFAGAHGNSRANSRNNSQSNLYGNTSGSNLSRPPSRHQIQQAQQNQLFQLPTTINIVAPSPMGSVRDVSRLTSRGDSPVDTKHFSTSAASGPYGSSPRPSSPMKRHSHQDILANMQQQQQQQQHLQQQHNALIDKTSQMSISGRRSIAGPCLPASATPCDQDHEHQQQQQRPGGAKPADDKSRSELIDELLKTINDDSFNEFIDFNNKLSAAAGASATSSQPDALNCGGGGGTGGLGAGGNLSASSAVELANAARSKSATGGESARSFGAALHSSSSTSTSPTGGQSRRQSCVPGGGAGRVSPAPPRSLALSSAAAGPGGRQSRGSICVGASGGPQQQQPGSTFDNVIRRMSTNFVQNFNKMSGGATEQSAYNNNNQQQQQYVELNIQQASGAMGGSASQLRREKSSAPTSSSSAYGQNSLYVDNQVPARRHSDNTINVPRIQVALSSPSSSGSRTNLNQRASVSASKLANKWKLTAKSNQREASDKLSPNLGGALTYIRRHSSGNTQGQDGHNNKDHHGGKHHHHQNQHNDSGGQSNGGLGASLLNASPFKTKSSSNLGIDFLMSNRSMKRRYSAASMLGHQTQRKAEDLIDAGMKSVQNMFS